MNFRLPLLAALFFAIRTLQAATYNVSTAAEFNALPSLGAGDIVRLQSGTYGAINKTLVSTISDDATAQSNPIIIIADVPGGVNIAAPSRINLQGSGIVLAGLDFVSGSGMWDNGDTSPAWIIRTLANSRYIRLSNLRFLNCNAGDQYGHWLFIEGFHHTIEYCSLEGKDAPSANATVAFKRSTSEAGIATPRQHLLRYCYFGPRECSTTDNGYETIRIGDSSSQAHDMQITIESNVFYHAIWREDGEKPNDMEIISNKSKGNRILYNTFLESYGQITLRHGDGCLVEGNFTFGGGQYSGSSITLNAANPYQGGVRLVGQDHIIRNNYFVNLDGTNFRAALCLMAGVDVWDDGDGSGGDNGYETTDDAQIYHNTFLDCKEINLGFINTGERQPIGVDIFNNAWQGSGTSHGVVRESAFSPASSGGNYLYHPSSSDLGWTGLGGTYSSSASPKLSDDFDHYKIPATSSPLLGAADLSLSSGEDIRGLPRPSTGRDIGSFELEVSGSGMRPLFRNEVGPVFDGGPANTYPVPGDTSPAIATSSLPSGTVGVSYQETLTATAGDGTHTWSLVAGTLPPGISLSSAGTLSGTPSITGSSNFTIMVTDADGDEDTKALSINISAFGSVMQLVFAPGDVSASAHQTTNVAANTIDEDLGTRWSAQGDGQWIQYDLGMVINVDLLKIAWLNGASRVSTFDIEISHDGSTWTPLATDEKSSGLSTDLETVELPDTFARFLRIVGRGNTDNDWNSINEVEIWGAAVPISPAELTSPAVTTSGQDVHLTMPSVPGRTYQIQRSSTLLSTDWANIGTPQFGTGNPLNFLDIDAANAPKQFYRLAIQP